MAHPTEPLAFISHGLLVVDGRQQIRYANAAMEAISGYRPQELQGEQPMAKLRLVLPLPARRMSGECGLRRKDGSIATVRWTVSPLKPGSGSAEEVIELRDVSEEAEMLRRLVERERLATAGQLAATLAHEVNNPLGVVANTLYLLQKSPQVRGRNRALVESAQGELQRATRVVKNTLALYRQADPQAAADANHAVASALELVQPRLQDKQIRVEQRLRARVAVAVPPGELRQMLANLIGNAADAAPVEGRLGLASRDDADDEGRGRVRLLVADNGPGISDADRRMIFRAFYTTKGERGTGLGLWVSAELARKNHCRLRLHSTTEAPSGTCFCLSCPAA